ncbi:MAG: sortase [bacterium]|nr:sortase [bacterium]
MAIGHKKRFWLFVFIRTLANTLIVVGVIFSFIAFWPFISSEIRYRWDQWRDQKYSIDTAAVPSSGLGGLLGKPPPIKITPVNKDFGIIIEKIHVNAPVITDVDSTKYAVYIDALNRGVAHARGTGKPGEPTKEGNNNTFLFAHSAINPFYAKKYNAVFYLLRKVEVGNRIVVFYKQKRFDYLVKDKRVVEASDVRYLTEPSKKPLLTLQTCDPPGSSLRRLIITAEPDPKTT